MFHRAGLFANEEALVSGAVKYDSITHAVNANTRITTGYGTIKACLEHPLWYFIGV